VSRLEIIDGQLHEPGLQRHWDAKDEVTQHAVLSEALNAMLAAVGVNGAVLHPIEDVGWASRMAESAPDRFVVVPMIAPPQARIRRWDSIDPGSSDLEERLATVAAGPGFSGFRLLPMGQIDALSQPGAGYEVALRFCEEHSRPVFLSAPGRPDQIEAVANRFPRLTLILDQMGLDAPPGSGADGWKGIAAVLALARYPNVNLKLTGLPALSATGEPFLDVEPHVIRLLDSYGAERCMWASDIGFYQGQIGWANRFPSLVGPYPGKHTYAQSLAMIRCASWLDEDQKSRLLGGTARALLNWNIRPAHDVI
jgi:L-fuconolactonase